MNKKNTKKVKPAFIVDLTNVEDSAEAMLAFANARFEAKVPLTQRDYDIIVAVATREALYASVEIMEILSIIDMMACHEVCNMIFCKKKLPWYKRLWNWIRHK